MNSPGNHKTCANVQSPLFPIRVEDRGLSFLLAFLLLIVIFVPSDSVITIRATRSCSDVRAYGFFGAVATIRHRSLMYLVIGLTILEFTADLMVQFKPAFGHWDWDTALKISGLAILVVMTLRQTFRPGSITVHRVMGGIAGYLLIGVTWAFGYKLLMEMRPSAIHFQSFVGGIPTAEPSRLMAFSFSTHTSVSYGDAYPVRRIARSLATAEALIGQLYPAVLIATLVGMSLQARSNTSAKSQSGR